MTKATKAVRSRASKTEESVHDHFGESRERGAEMEADFAPRVNVSPAVESELRVKLSEQLLRKLRETAADEGIDLGALVGELLAEGVTLRAWEIIERKSAMRGPSVGGGNFAPSHNNQPRYGSSHRQGSERGGNIRGQQQGERNGNSRYGYSGPHHRRQPNQQPNNNAWMEDKAAFLEYVRNQEKQRRR